MSEDLEGKIAAVTGAASGIGLATTKALMAKGVRVVLVDRDAAALDALSEQYGDAVVPMPTDLLDTEACAGLVDRIIAEVGALDILHANAGSYVGGDLVETDPEAIDRTIQLNVGVVMKNVRAALPHMIERGRGDIVVTSSVAGHFPTPWEPVYAPSKWAMTSFVQIVRRQVASQGVRVGSVSPGPVASALLSDWPEEKLREAKESGSLIEPGEVADAIVFMLERPRHVTIRDMVIMPTNFDL